MQPEPTPQQIARLIDHTLLRADATEAEIRQVCAEALEHGFAAVCVNTRFIHLVAKTLAQSPDCKTLPIAVVGFPLGACTTEAKVFETRQAVELGAREIDMVIALGALKDEAPDGTPSRSALVEADIRAVVEAAREAACPVPVKVILETALLSDAQKIRACTLAVRAGAAFVKTSTGFATPSGGRPSGATVQDVALMRRTVDTLSAPSKIGVKASGGIRTLADARAMIAAGADRLGVSASVALVTEGINARPNAGGAATDSKKHLSDGSGSY